jgi:hypothetical protein
LYFISIDGMKNGNSLLLRSLILSISDLFEEYLAAIRVFCPRFIHNCTKLAISKMKVSCPVEFLTLVGALLLFVNYISCSFMAVGPPGAPVALYMNSSVGLETQFKPLLLTEQVSHWSDLPQDVLTNSSLSDDSAFDVAAGYWFLADPAFKHQVSMLLSASFY